jgi:hypothetical protein
VSAVPKRHDAIEGVYLSPDEKALMMSLVHQDPEVVAFAKAGGLPMPTMQPSERSGSSNAMRYSSYTPTSSNLTGSTPVPSESKGTDDDV